MKKRLIAAALMAGAMLMGTSSPAFAAGDGGNSYTVTIPSKLNVSGSGWNDAGGISATGALESGKVLTVTATSGNSWALKSGDNAVGYNLSTESGTYSSSAEPASWEFKAAEVAASGGTNKGMGINVEDYSEKPAGNYTDTVTFTAAVNDEPVTVPAFAFRRRAFENDDIDPDEARNFRQGETVAVTAAGKNPAVYECNNAEDQTWTLKEGEQFRWTANPLNFQAYSPATEGTSMTSFTMPTDQSTPEKLAAADYMTREQYISKPDGDTDIHMELERKMSKVKVHVKGFSSAYTDDEKYISDGSMKIYSQAEKLEDGNPSGDSTEVKPYIQKANSADNGYKVGSTFTAHVIPADGDEGARFLQFSNGRNDTLNVKGIPELEQGKAYEYDLGVGKEGAVLMDHNPTPIQSITLQDQTVTIGGERFDLQPTISPSSASCKALEWFIPGAADESLDYLETAHSYMINTHAAMCTRDYYEGQTYGAKPGTYKVYAYALDGSGVVGECNVTVLPKYVTSFNLNKTATTISVGNKETLSAIDFAPSDATYKTVTWSSDNESVATVNAQTGEVTGVAAGTANITATANDDDHAVTATCTVTVNASTPVTAITLNKTATTISAGQTETLSVSSVTPDDATDQTVTWSSDNTNVATVNATTGEVTAKALGTANITATANGGSGVTATCAVTVSKVVTINQSDWGGWGRSFTKDGVTVSAGMIDPNDGNLMDGGTFSTTLGNFTKIVVTTASCSASGTGWSGSRSSMTWTGTPASTVSFSGEFMGMGMTQTTIVCTIVPTN